MSGNNLELILKALDQYWSVNHVKKNITGTNSVLLNVETAMGHLSIRLKYKKAKKNIEHAIAALDLAYRTIKSLKSKNTCKDLEFLKSEISDLHKRLNDKKNGSNNFLSEINKISEELKDIQSLVRFADQHTEIKQIESLIKQLYSLSNTLHREASSKKLPLSGN